MSRGDFLESLSQAMLVGTMVVGIINVSREIGCIEFYSTLVCDVYSCCQTQAQLNLIRCSFAMCLFHVVRHASTFCERPRVGAGVLTHPKYAQSTY